MSLLKKRGVVFALFQALVLMSFLRICLAPTAAWAQIVSVGLVVGQPSLSVSSVSAITAVDGSGKKQVLGTAAAFRMSGSNSVVVGNRTFRLPITLSSRHALAFDGRRYRGTFRLIASGSGMTLINALDLEEYLRGVLKMEVNPAWSMEALKAQAIISRTYALRSVFQNSGKGGYDLRDSVMSQVYRGMNAEDPKTDEAIRATKGMVLKYGSEIAFTPFHSHSGGATADVSTVWGGNMPYLKGVNESFRTESPHSSWEARLTVAQVEEALRSAGVNVGRLQELRVEQTDSFGRATTLRAIGTIGSQTLKSHSFRMAAGSNIIRSTVFTIASAGTASPAPAALPPLPQPNVQPSSSPGATNVPTSLTPMNAAEERMLTELTEKGVFNAEELMDMLLNPDKRKGYLIRALRTVRPEIPAQPQPQPVGSSSGQFHFRGKGWGHGVGLSQWGAKALADQGWDFKKILSFYYPGTKLERM